MDINSILQPHQNGSGYQAYMQTKSGKRKLSIIAGQYFYSSPREDLLKPEYDKFEVAVLTTENKWVARGIRTLLEKNKLPLGDYEYNSGAPVIGYVTADQIEKMIEVL